MRRLIAQTRGKTSPSIARKSASEEKNLKPPGTRTARPTTLRSASTTKWSVIWFLVSNRDPTGLRLGSAAMLPIKADPGRLGSCCGKCRTAGRCSVRRALDLICSHRSADPGPRGVRYCYLGGALDDQSRGYVP